jgi:hypothetical protein
MAAARGAWKDDNNLKNLLEDLVRKGYKMNEILMTAKKDFPQYTWGCVKTLDRRLQHFALNYIDYDTPLKVVQGAIAQELEGPGSLLGVRAMTKKLRIHHNIKVPQI